jgi:hypothetical protein
MVDERLFRYSVNYGQNAPRFLLKLPIVILVATIKQVINEGNKLTIEFFKIYYFQ